ncbi:MAG: exodeoxyribonuclease III [Opitutales bacterium]|nr:exodeoxyribonuclease III [Opitutales bacterium]
MKLHSWNVNGLRAVLKKNFEEYLATCSPDILMLQEIKCPADLVLPQSITSVYKHCTLRPAVRPGYSGTALLSKIEPLSVDCSFAGTLENPHEGRVIAAEYKNIFVVNAYVPNAQNELARLDFRIAWDRDFRAYLKELERKKPVAVCGDFNCAHQPIDLENPKANEQNPGYSIEERTSFGEHLAAGFIDSFRDKNPELAKAYSWWSYRTRARERNVGWRIDYWLLSRALKNDFCDPAILSDITGSDHCPVAVTLDDSLF